MVFVTTIANQLNKDEAYVLKLCEDKQIEVHYDQDGVWIYDDQAKLLLDNELKTPTRYNCRELDCTTMQKIMISDDSIQSFWLGNIIKYLYRRLNVSDLKKARQYLDFWIEYLEKGDKNIR